MHDKDGMYNEAAMEELIILLYKKHNQMQSTSKLDPRGIENVWWVLVYSFLHMCMS